MPQRHGLRVDRIDVVPVASGQHGHVGFRAGRGVGLPGAGGPVRKLVVAAGGDPGRADVPVVFGRRRAVGQDGHQHFHADRFRRAGWPGRQERDPDRRVRQAAAGRRQSALQGHA